MRPDSKLVRTVLYVQLIITIMIGERWRDVRRKTQSSVEDTFPSVRNFPVASNGPPRPLRSVSCYVLCDNNICFSYGVLSSGSKRVFPCFISSFVDLRV